MFSYIYTKNIKNNPYVNLIFLKALLKAAPALFTTLCVPYSADDKHYKYEKKIV